MPQKVLTGAAAITLATALASGSAHAQTLPSIDARTWRPSTDPSASLITEPAVTPGPGAFSVGGYASYALRPVTLRRAGTDDVAYRPLEHVVGLDAVANFGVGQRFAMGAAVPVILYQEGSTGLPPTISSVERAPVTGIGDVAATMKGALIPNEGGGLGLAGLGYVTFPTGDRAGFMGDGSMTVSARLLAEYTLLVAGVQASLGYKLRTDLHTWPAESVGGYRFGDELPWTVGLTLRPGLLGVDPGNRQRWELAAHGWVPAGPVGPFGGGDPGSAALSPVLLAASDRIELGHYRDAFVTAGVELGLSQAVGTPLVRGVVAVGWSPREHDMDHDGVKDDVDGCPEIPEDKDGFEDSDGCPEIDNDDDGVLDKEDACPSVAGAESKDPKKNGCASADTGSEDVADPHDVCPTQPEDKEGVDDEDGCPAPDNDGDGIVDRDDACPNAAGEPSTDPARNGCPSPDRDGDSYDNDADKCPDSAEVFNGVDDEDGCPDEGGKPLLTIDDKRNVRVATAIKISGTGENVEVDRASMMTLRALALELNRHRDWTLAIGVRPAGGDPTKAHLEALARSFAVVRALSSLSRRDGVAETVGWDAVKKQPQAGTGMALLVLVTPGAPSGSPAPLEKKP